MHSRLQIAAGALPFHSYIMRVLKSLRQVTVTRAPVGLTRLKKKQWTRPGPGPGR
jgi:hypothetical protein